MEQKKIEIIFKKRRSIQIIFGLLFFLMSCSHHESINQVTNSTGAQLKGEEIPQGGKGTSLEVKNSSEELEDKKKMTSEWASHYRVPTVGVFIGAGGALSLGGLGLIKAFESSKVQVKALSGIEWGAVVSGLYAQKGSTSGVEWSFYKLFQKKIFKNHFFNQGLPQFHQSLFHEWIKEEGSFALQKGKFFGCPSWDGNFYFEETEQDFSLFEAIKKCALYPPFALGTGEDFFNKDFFKFEQALKWFKERNIANVIVVLPQPEGIFNEKMDQDPQALSMMKSRKKITEKWLTIKKNNLENKHLKVFFVEIKVPRAYVTSFDQWRNFIRQGEQLGLGLVEKERGFQR